VRSVLVDRNGVLWVGTRDGLNSFRDNEFTTYTTQDGLANNFIGAIYEDSKGNLWVGTLGGLNKIKDGKFQTFTPKTVFRATRHFTLRRRVGRSLDRNKRRPVSIVCRGR
jgi:ligand-binding sensor domain-containing protein